MAHSKKSSSCDLNAGSTSSETHICQKQKVKLYIENKSVTIFQENVFKFLRNLFIGFALQKCKISIFIIFSTSTWYILKYSSSLPFNFYRHFLNTFTAAIFFFNFTEVLKFLLDLHNV